MGFKYTLTLLVVLGLLHHCLSDPMEREAWVRIHCSIYSNDDIWCGSEVPSGLEGEWPSGRVHVVRVEGAGWCASLGPGTRVSATHCDVAAIRGCPHRFHCTRKFRVMRWWECSLVWGYLAALFLSVGALLVCVLNHCLPRLLRKDVSQYHNLSSV